MVTLARTSKKDQILASAIEIIGEDGIHAVTYDRLAETTGLSKSGLIYHFPSRHALLRDIHPMAPRAGNPSWRTTPAGAPPTSSPQPSACAPC